MREDVLGYAVDARTADGCIPEMVAWARGGGHCRWLACLNPHSYAVARSDQEFATALRRADWLIPDGVGIVLASRLLGGSIAARITGSDVFAGVLDGLARSGGGRVYFLGSTVETLSEIRMRMAIDYPTLEVVGTLSPPFQASYSQAQQCAMVEAINEARPHVLWVGLTAPKQEKWLQENATRLKVPFAAAIGAVFDFYAGSVRRSGPAFQRAGLEWLPRLVREPRRLWRRMLVSAPIFARDVIRERLRRSGGA